ncbi:MAG: hypothetical protein C5B50_28265 [Verrucomicrobia bacterium]|nr:MAG: hypothetical protein C5B50_28265 [Verrucomicrobiota bacterium]
MDTTEYRAALGPKPDPMPKERVDEARRLTSLMRRGQAFSFVRLGDYDLGYLLDEQLQKGAGTASSPQFEGCTNKCGDEAVPAPAPISGTRPFGSPGLLPCQAGRLRAALEGATYLDFHELLWKDNSLIDALGVRRKESLFRNPDRTTSYILATWLDAEFRSFCAGRRILFCGAEAPLLEAMLKRERFLECARDYWQPDCAPFFLRPRDNGRNLGENLDSIKQDLKEAILRWKIDTLFLCLGGAAKILCYELAKELGICAIDFGVGLRSLTYSGSDGSSAARSTHLVFLYRVPFDLYMDALAEAFPSLIPEETLAKAHAQLLLEVQEKEVGWSHSGWEYDFSEENIAAFRAAFVHYRRRCRALFRHSPASIKERKDFLHFCGSHGLTFEGRLFLRSFQAKGFVRRFLGSGHRGAPRESTRPTSPGQFSCRPGALTRRSGVSR